MDPVVLMGDPAVARIPVDECGESLAEAGDAFVMSGLKAGLDPHRSRLRQSVHDRLLSAGAQLPEGISLCWVEGQRMASLQEEYFEGYRRQLLADDPTLTEEASQLRASRFVSPPAIAPHVSGAAIDLTLCDETGAELDLGTPVNASPEASDGACYFDAPVSPAARQNRTVLADALSEAGLVNYPTEWWHWSFGDRYWALMTGRSSAIYGPVADS